MRKLSKNKCLKAIEGTGGIIQKVVDRLGVSRVAYWEFEKKYPELKQAREMEKEKQVDMSEHQLFKANRNGEKWAVNKILSTLGKNRGYVEKQEIENSGSINNNIRIEFVGVDEEELQSDESDEK